MAHLEPDGELDADVVDVPAVTAMRLGLNRNRQSVFMGPPSGDWMPQLVHGSHRTKLGRET